ncbi:adenosylmethionine--8-amino-7-oxononanoate transaminase [bacterium F11]|nr:adenosylmethionine--8-amino-7-oxononanoate transaminase [bacterium F11]
MARQKKITPSQLEKWDKQFLWHPFTQHYIWEKESPLIIESGKGVTLRDVKGRSFLDGVSSLWVNLHGHNHPFLNAAIKKQLSKIAHSTFLGLSHKPGILLARKLVQLAPKGLDRVFYADNGATAVEVALKMAYQYWVENSPQSKRKNRCEFMALQGSYHGDTIGAVSLGSVGPFHSKFKPLLFKSHFAMAPSCFRCPFNKNREPHRTRLGERIRKVPHPGDRNTVTGCAWQCLSDVQRILKKKSKDLAAAVIEPVVQGATGINVMPPGYVAGFSRLCRRHGILLIADEVATGFGRTGTLFAVEQEGVNPDFLCLAKSITGGYSPLSATLTRNRIYKAFWGPIQKGNTFFHGHSYTAHPLGAAVALANIDLIESRKLLEKSRYKATLMKEALRALKDLPHVGSIRQSGLMSGIEIVQNKNTMKPFPYEKRMGAHICKKLLSHGIWMRPLGDTIVVMPPLAISPKEIGRMVKSLYNVILHEIKT